MPPAAIRNLIERRVPQYLAIYLGAAWGLVQFVDFIATHYGLSPRWTNMALLAMALLLPSVLLYTYFHGRPGPDEWRKSEKVFIPVNVLLLLAVLFFVGANTNLSAVTTRLELKDEKGNTIERVVVNKEYRKRVALFSFNPLGNTDKWLSIAAPMLAAVHLQQQQVIQPVIPVDLRQRLIESGYRDGLNVPLTLQRELADERHIAYFVAGTVQLTGAGVTAHVQLYETASARLLAEHTFTAPSVTAVADLIAQNLFKDLDVPVLPDDKPQLSTADITTQNASALRACFEGLDAYAWRNDYRAAMARLDEAVRLDPTFAYANLLRYSMATALGSRPDIISSIQAALDHSYRLPERTQQYVKVGYYEAKQDYPHAFAILDMLSQLYPEDVTVLEQKVQVSQIRDDKPTLIATLKKVLELDPTRGELLLSLGRVYERAGDAQNALQQYQAYAKRYPTEHYAFKTIGDLYVRIGEPAKARSAYEQALLLKPDDVETLVSYVDLECHIGDFAAAEDKLQQAMAAAKSAHDSASVLEGRAALQNFRGQIGASIATVEQRLAVAAQFAPPSEVVWQRLLLTGRIAQLDPRRAQAQLAELKQKLGPLYAMFSPIADLGIYWELQNAAGEESAAVALDETIQKTSFNSLRPLVLEGHARAQELRGNCAAALQWYDQMHKAWPLDVSVQRGIGRCYRKMGRIADAQSAWNVLLRVVPADGEANLEMALLYKQAGDLARSKQYAAVAMRTWQNADAGYKLPPQARALL